MRGRLRQVGCDVSDLAKLAQNHFSTGLTKSHNRLTTTIFEQCNCFCFLGARKLEIFVE